jgi:F-box protein 11
VEIGHDGNPILRRNQIHDNKGGGIYVHDSGLGTLEDNDITGNRLTGIEIMSGGNPTVRGNRINRNGYKAVWIYDGGRGVVEDNDLTGNKRGARDVEKDCQANVTRARNKE